MLRVCRDGYVTRQCSQPGFQPILDLCSVYLRPFDLTKLAPDSRLHESIAFGAVKIDHFQIQLVPTVVADHGYADQLTVDEVGEFAVEKQQHVVSPRLIYRVVSESATEADYFATPPPLGVFPVQNNGWCLRYMDGTTMDTIPTRTLSDAEKASLAKQLHALFDHWRLSPAQRLGLMGVAGKPNGANAADNIDWAAYLTGEGLERAGHLLAIHALLRTLFPDNIELAYGWMQTPNKAFAGTSPVALVEESGIAGLLSVLTYLDNALT